MAYMSGTVASMTTDVMSNADQLSEIAEAELAAEALAAGDPDQSIPVDALPFGALLGADGAPGPLLPDWYMPAPAHGSTKRSHRVMAWSFIAALVAINLSGLCVTYGHLVLA